MMASRLLPRTWPSRRKVMLGLFVVGLINGIIVLRPFSRETIDPVPMSAAIAPAGSGTSIGLRAYLSFAKAQVAPVAEREAIHASIMFLSYFLMSTRGMGEFCDRTGVDLGVAKATFANVHQDEYERASTVLAGHGVNSETLWGLFKPNLTGLAEVHLEQYGTRFNTNRTGTCARLAGEPENFAALRFFRTNHPAIYAQLMN